MRHFLRILKYSWPYRYRLLASVGCALTVAALWSLNLSAIYPVLKILSTDKNLQQWVDEEIEGHERKRTDTEDKLKHRKDLLKGVQATWTGPTRENEERRLTGEIAELEGESKYA